MVRQMQSVAGSTASLRTRYFPKNRIGHGFISVAPWLDVVLLVLCFVILESRFIFQRGMILDLPASTSADILQTDTVVIIRSVETGGSGERREMVFFDDMCFQVQSGAHMEMLRQKLSERVNGHSESGLVLYSDSEVRQGTLARVLNLAREAGIVRVNIASGREDIGK